MSLRYCIYKDCSNYINLKDRSVNKDVKLFSFPKNPERRQKWMEYGQVPPNLPSTMYYFCADHFDKKFFATNNVRTILVGEAMPYPYVEVELNNDNYEEDSSNNFDYILYEMNKDNEINCKQKEQDLHVESTTITNEFQEEHYSINLDNAKNDECIFISEEENNTQVLHVTDSSSNKRKYEDSDTIMEIQPSSSKEKISKASPVQKPKIKSLEETKNLQELETIKNPVVSTESIEQQIKEDELIDKEYVTTFIFKGEEYVQMPKNHYVNEKMELMKKLQKMEQTIKTIKQHLSFLDL
ncbi:dorsal interacting protein 2 [Cochliomyia hominivorax]